jgi:hypothetical protein
MSLFFFDCCVPEPLVRMLDQYDRENQVIFLGDRFRKDTPDEKWLEQVAQWAPVPVVVSGDSRILRNPAQAQVLSNLPLTIFFFAESWPRLPWREWAWKGVKIWPQILDNSSPRSPSIFRIPISANKVELYSETRDLSKGKKRKNR